MHVLVEVMFKERKEGGYNSDHEFSIYNQSTRKSIVDNGK